MTKKKEEKSDSMDRWERAFKRWEEGMAKLDKLNTVESECCGDTEFYDSWVDELGNELDQLRQEKAEREYRDATARVDQRRVNLRNEIQAAISGKMKAGYAADVLSFTLVDLIEAIVARGESPYNLNMYAPMTPTYVG